MVVDILIVEDDVHLGLITETVLADLGYRCRRLLSSSRALDCARRWRPSLVITDIMMPGVDGLALCRRLKADPATKDIPVLVASSKSASRHRELALGAGASGFIEKPLDTDVLAELAGKLAGRPRAEADGPPAVTVTFWGSRGPSPAGSADGPRVKTSCVSVQAASGECFILDAGSGIADCAARLAPLGLREITLLLTHYHQDHVEGLPGLSLLRQPGLALKIAGPEEPKTLEALVKGAAAGLREPPRASVKPFFLYEQAYALSPSVYLEALYAQHGGTTLAYSLEIEGRKIVYCPDSQLDEGDDLHTSDYEDKLTRFATGADLLIHDARYAPEDAVRARAEGHSTWPNVLRVAADTGARSVALFHLDGAYGEQRLAAIEGHALAAREEARLPFACFLARDGASVAIA
ncbi:MAG: response regulator [Elusimicrobia bacterium]|nr:response regulator [Elusimicrobiota bacterium]